MDWDRLLSDLEQGELLSHRQEGIRSIHLSLALSYDQLTADEQGFFRTIGVFPEDASVSVEEAAIVGGCDEYEAEELLERLMSMSLVERVESTGGYRLHPLVRNYAIQKSQEVNKWETVSARYQTYKIDKLRGSLFEFDGALQELVDRALQSEYGQEWPTRLNVDRKRLTLGEFFRLVIDKRDIFEPLLNVPEAYDELVAAADRITNVRNALFHGAPSPHAEMEEIHELVEWLLPIIRNAIVAQGTAPAQPSQTVSHSEFVQLLVDATRRATQEVCFVEIVRQVDWTEDLMSLPLISGIQEASQRGVNVEIVYVLEGDQALPSVLDDMSSLSKVLGWGIQDRLVRVQKPVDENTFGIYDSREAYQVVESAQGRTMFEKITAAGRIEALRSRFEYWWGGASELIEPDLRSWVLVATFRLSTQEVLASEELPPHVPSDYPHLCDWLEEDLQRRLRDSIGDFKYTEASQRTGETLSVRIAFQRQPQDRQPDFGDLGWWSLLELAPFEEIYPGQDAAYLWGE